MTHKGLSQNLSHTIGKKSVLTHHRPNITHTILPLKDLGSLNSRSFFYPLSSILYPPDIIIYLQISTIIQQSNLQLTRIHTSTQKGLPRREVFCISFIGLIVCVLFLKRGQSSRMSFVCSESLIYSISIMEVRSYALSKACAKSSMISSIFSRPMDTRIISGVTPADFCCSSLSCACVVDAG